MTEPHVEKSSQIQYEFDFESTDSTYIKHKQISVSDNEHYEPE